MGFPTIWTTVVLRARKVRPAALQLVCQSLSLKYACHVRHDPQIPTRQALTSCLPCWAGPFCGAMLLLRAWVCQAPAWLWAPKRNDGHAAFGGNLSRSPEAAVGLSETCVSAGATAAAANSEEIDIDDVDDLDDLEEEFVDDRAAGQGSGQGRSGSAAAADAGRGSAAEESMFAPVEMHNYNPLEAAAESAGRINGAHSLPEEMYDVLKQ